MRRIRRMGQIVPRRLMGSRMRRVGLIPPIPPIRLYSPRLSNPDHNHGGRMKRWAAGCLVLGLVAVLAFSSPGRAVSATITAPQQQGQGKGKGRAAGQEAHPQINGAIKALENAK